MNIKDSLLESLKSNKITSIAADVGEAIMDSSLDEGILKDIPIIGTLMNLNNGILTIQDRIFAKKIMSFLSKLEDIPEKDKVEAIEKIENSKEEKIKVGEKILYLVDKADDHVKAELIGKLFAQFIKNIISYEAFKRSSDIINKCYLDDLIWFLESDIIELSMEESSDLISAGLFELPYSLQIKNKGNTDHFVGDDFVIEGYDKATVSFFAKEMREALK